MSQSVYVVAVEPSGDQLGAGLISELRKVAPNFDIRGIGGAAMRAAGVPSQIDIDGLAILGFVEGLKSYGLVLRKVREATERILAAAPDAVVLIDSWGFMIRVAKRLKSEGFTGQIIKYVAPQVWAMREGRSATLAQHVDHLLTIHSFDAPYFEHHGLPVHYVGNAVFDTDYLLGDADALAQIYGLENRPILSVYFGSRPSEVANLAQPFTDTVLRLKKSIPDLVAVSPVSASVAEEVGAAAGADPRMNEIILLPEDKKLDVFAASTAALACSGTVTTQLACAGVPTVVAYRLSPLTWFVASRLSKLDHVSIVNIAAKSALMPEYLQTESSSTNLAEALTPYLTDTKKRQAASSALLEQTAKMRGGSQSASAKAARAVLSILA